MAAGDDVTILHDELVAIEGIADAHVEIVEDGPPSVRLQVEPGADRRRVGESVQQILANHGLKSRLAPERTESEPVVAPAPPSDGLSAAPADPDAGQEYRPNQVRHLVALAVEEDRRSVKVTARDDRDRTVSTVGQTSRRSLRDAIVGAVSELIDDEGVAPSVVAIHRASEGSREIITVVLDRGAGDLAVGAAFVTVGWEFAFGRAVWAALTD
ncbi:MAG: hypothetical protein P1T08_00315 [Acidimicrobiia bacterium]|nr:hypothetical protein [Acidimicrobiia bacterium]